MNRRVQTTGMMIAALLLFTQCQKDVLIDFSDFTPKLAINAQLTPETGFEVLIKESTSPVASVPGEVPENLTFRLIDQTLNVEIGLYRENDTYVAPAIKPRAGHTYRLTAQAGGLQPIITETTIPQHQEVRDIGVENVAVVPSEETEGKSNVSYDMNISLDKDHGQYLHITFWQLTRLNVGTVESPDFEEFIYLIGPEFPEEDGFRKHHEQGVLVDRYSQENPEQLPFSFRDYTVNEFEELGDLLVAVRTTCPGYYRYFDSLARQLVSREDPLAEPIPTYNNVEGGLGNFSSYDLKVYRTQLFR